MSNILLRSAVLFASMVVLAGANSAIGQTQSGIAPAVSGIQNQAQAQTAVQTGSQKEAAAKQRPWKLTSRIHLEKGTTKGYLVVQLDLADGYHVYSLNPKGSPSPTKLTVSQSNDLRLISNFASDKAPIVIEKDPVFEQRIEKHKGQVQFFASIEVRQGVDLQKFVQEIQFSGQVCSESACQPIRNQAATAKFSGYFEPPKTRNAANEQKLK